MRKDEKGRSIRTSTCTTEQQDPRYDRRNSASVLGRSSSNSQLSISSQPIDFRDAACHAWVHVRSDGARGAKEARKPSPRGSPFFRVRIPNSDSQEALWLILERRDGAAQRDRAYLCSLPERTTRKRLSYIHKERWCTEAVYQESKQQLGLGQYQGRLYPGLQHHLSAVICAYAFIVAERERVSADGNPSAAPMQRTAQILQRHSPYSIATLRKQIAFALGPWLFDYLEAHQPRRKPCPNPTPSQGQTNSAGG